jgi:uncharacterized Zn finger protein
MTTATTDSFTAAQVAKARDLIAADGLVPTNRQGVFRAVSSDGQHNYLVTADGICECPAGQRDRACYHAAAAIRTARLDALRATARAAGWTARVVTLPADERAERIRDYALEG